MKSDLIELNSINVAALGVTFADIDAVLTTLVLVTALIYNIRRLSKQWNTFSHTSLNVTEKSALT